MNEAKILPDDPRLTAYALGELEGAERAAIEAALRDNPAARAAVEEIRALGAQLQSALAAEPLPAAEPVAPGPDPVLDPYDRPAENPLSPRILFRFPQFYYVVGALAAACVALMVRLHTPPPAPRQPLAHTEVVPPGPEPIAAVTVQLQPPAAPADATVAETPVIATPAVPEAAVRPGANAFTAARSLVGIEQLSLLNQTKSFGEAARDITPFQVGGMETASPLVARSRPSVAVSVAIPSRRWPADFVSAVPAPANDADAARPSATASSATANGGKAPAFSPDNKFVSGSAAPLLVASAAEPPSKPPAPVAAKEPAANATSTTPAAARVALVLPPPPLPPIAHDTLALSAFEGAKGPVRAIAPLTADMTGARPAIDNDFINAAQTPISTFSIDTDATGYASIRRLLQNGQRPPREAVRIEELLNYFPFRYSPPKGDTPFAASMEVADAPWAPAHRLVRIGLQAREVASAVRPAADLVFVLDVVGTERLVSGLPMIRESIQELIDRLRPDDRVAIVTCADNGGVVLPPTPVAQSKDILAALEAVTAGPTSSRARGLQLGYDLAQASAGTGKRVILCTDGNAGVTITSEGPLAHYIDAKTKAGVTLTAFGFGMGIYQDSLIELLADYGKGNYGYFNSRREAERGLIEEVNGAPVTIAKDVNIQVQFNPAKVASYRLIGYENRKLKKEDFHSDAFEAGEIDAGHAMTALFEIVPAAGPPAANRGAALAKAPDGLDLVLDPNELLTMKVRYKRPGGAISRKLNFPLFDSRARFVDASADFKFAAAVAGFGMVLRDSPHKGATTLTNVIEWAGAAAGDDPGGYRGEFIELAREAEKVVR